MRPHTTVPTTACLLLILAASGVPSEAQEDGAPVSIGTYRVIESEVLGETRRLLIQLPRGYDGATIRYPVVYHTYGDYLPTYYSVAFSTLEALDYSARAPQMILVGIDNIDRYRDLRPLQQDGSPTRIERYTGFLTDEVIPFVEKNYRTAGFRILVGPQAGAVFCLHTLQTRPELFDAFILNNPLVSEPSTTFLLEQARTFYAEQESLRKFFFISFGGVDESPGDVAEVYRLAELAAPARDKGFELQLNHLVGNDDYIPPLGLKQGLETLFQEYYVPEDQRTGTLAEIKRHYAGLSDRYGYDVAPAEIVMTRSADTWLERGDVQSAVEILEYETALYPNMVNPWWRLAGIAADKGETERAIELYRKCVALNPSMANFVNRRIDALRSQSD